MLQLNGRLFIQLNAHASARAKVMSRYA